MKDFLKFTLATVTGIILSSIVLFIIGMVTLFGIVSTADTETIVKIRTIVKGDSLSASIAAASILAKVTRDRLMEQYDEQYPQYGFAVHKGYGTKRHYAALREYGPCPIHRQTFLKKFYAGT